MDIQSIVDLHESKFNKNQLSVCDVTPKQTDVLPNGIRRGTEFKAIKVRVPF